MLLHTGTLLATMAALVGATPGMFRRDFALIQGALNNVNSLLQTIDTSIVALTPENVATNGPQLLQLGQEIMPTLQGVVAQVQSSQVLTLDETNGLNTARTALNHNVNLTVSDLVRQKPVFDAVPGLSTQVAGVIQQVRDQAGGFFQAITTKLDPAAPDVSSIFTESLAVFDMAIAVFNGQAQGAVTGGAAAGSDSLPVMGLGTIQADGSCQCAVACPAGQMMMMSV